MRYTYFVAYAANHNSGKRYYGRCKIDRNTKISSFLDVRNIERVIENDVGEFRPYTVVITNFKVIKRRINWWWSK